jgi:DNA-binding NarL/FixJ family response regulator
MSVDAALVSIIIADEMQLLREALASLCERDGRFMVVGQCGDGETALGLIRQFQPALAVVDLTLPRLHTMELISKIRQTGIETRFIVLSNRSDRKTVLEGLRCGANAFVLKNGPAAHFFEAMVHALQGGVYLSPEIRLEQVFGAKIAEQSDPLSHLSSREHQVFSLLVEGIRAKEIAARLDLSPKTVDTYRASLMRKLDIHDVAGLVKYAIGRNLIAAHIG